MNLIAKKIRQTRKLKGLTQEELAELSQINLRTIQRIENSENDPRSKTLNLICEVLQIDVSEMIADEGTPRHISLGSKILKGLFLIALNLILMGIIGFLTLDSNANTNSRFGGFLISILLPAGIVLMTNKMNGTERVLKFGIGYFAYFISTMILTGFAIGFVSGLFPCLLISLFILYFGADIIKTRE